MSSDRLERALPPYPDAHEAHSDVDAFHPFIDANVCITAAEKIYIISVFDLIST